MKIEGIVRDGGTFYFEVSKTALPLITATPNNEPKGETAEKEMEKMMSNFLTMLEFAFSAPEPLRRSFVAILSGGLAQITAETHSTLGTVAKLYKQRVAQTN